jgi:hypothetical protein
MSLKFISLVVYQFIAYVTLISNKNACLFSKYDMRKSLFCASVPIRHFGALAYTRYVIDNRIAKNGLREDVEIFGELLDGLG